MVSGVCRLYTGEYDDGFEYDYKQPWTVDDNELRYGIVVDVIDFDSNHVFTVNVVNQNLNCFLFCSRDNFMFV